MKKVLASVALSWSCPTSELHAHLSGSISQNTINKLVQLKKSNSSGSFGFTSFSFSNYSDWFQAFDFVHDVTDSPEAVYQATCDVIKEFYEDGVIYLELRFTPRCDGNFKSQEIYVETVMRAVEHTLLYTEGMIVKLLLSINRGYSVKTAEETVKIAERYFYSSSRVIGIDLSGNPYKGNIKDFLPIMHNAKRIGLQLAIHVSEIPGSCEETEEILSLLPQRLGHGIHLHPSCGGEERILERLKLLQIPLEICLSSNIVCKCVPSYKEHHFPLFYKMNYPCVLCTDDKGIFNTTLSNEYYLASKYYSLCKSDLLQLASKSIDYVFCKADVKDLKNTFKQKVKSI